MDELNKFADSLNKINYEGIDIMIQDFHYQNLITFKYQFFAKNQIFGTCWANAYSAAIFLTNKRILGKKIESFEIYRENLLKYASNINTDGGDINNPKVKEFFDRQRLHYNEIKTEEEARKIVMKGRFLVFRFFLKEKQWTNFSNFGFNNKRGILTEDILNKGCENDTNPGGHAIVLIEVARGYLRFLNSWGSNWGDKGTFKVEKASILKPINTSDTWYNPTFYHIYYYENELTNEEKSFYVNNNKLIREVTYNYRNMSIEHIKNYMNYLYNNFSNMAKDLIEYFPKIKFSSDNNIADIFGTKLSEYIIFYDLMFDGNMDFDINFKEDYYIHIDREELHKDFKGKIKNGSDCCSIGSENNYYKTIDSIFIKEVNNVINLKDNIFIACGSNTIVVFEFKNEFIKYLIMRNILNENLVYLCDLKIDNENLIATGGEDLKIFQINYEKHDLNLQFEFSENKKINKIILINERNPGILKRIVVCDQNGYIGFYDIKDDDNKIDISFINKCHCHNSSINCILYLPSEGMLVSGSCGDKKIKFWEIVKNNLFIIKEFNNIPSTIYNDSFLDINKNLLVGEKDGISVYKYGKKRITFSFFYKNEEFGGIYSMKSLRDNYFICGRAFGFCSIFLLRENNIRNINVFRNNNLRASDKPYDLKDDKFYITNICVKKPSESSGNIGNILVSSVDRTLKIYWFKYKKNENY